MVNFGSPTKLSGKDKAISTEQLAALAARTPRGDASTQLRRNASAKEINGVALPGSPFEPPADGSLLKIVYHRAGGQLTASSSRRKSSSRMNEGNGDILTWSDSVTGAAIDEQQPRRSCDARAKRACSHARAADTWQQTPSNDRRRRGRHAVAPASRQGLLLLWRHAARLAPIKPRDDSAGDGKQIGRGGGTIERIALAAQSIQELIQLDR